MIKKISLIRSIIHESNRYFQFYITLLCESGSKFRLHAGHTHTVTCHTGAFCVIGSSTSFASQGTGRHAQHVNTLQARALNIWRKIWTLWPFFKYLCSNIYFTLLPSFFFSMLCKHVDSQKNTMSLHYLQSESLTSWVTVSVQRDGM